MEVADVVGAETLPTGLAILDGDGDRDHVMRAAWETVGYKVRALAPDL